MRNLLLSSATLLLVPAVSMAAPGFITYTHTDTPIELKPISDISSSLKLASICFLGVGDCDPNAGFGTGDDYSMDTVQQCLDEGYGKQNCNSVQTIDGVCPYNPAYGLGCKCAPNLVSCPAGQDGVGESCGGKYVSCQCDPALISCASNQVGQGASCGGKYESCACRPEYKYTSSNCSYPRSVSGDSCGGKYTGCDCPSGVNEGQYGCDEYYPAPCETVCKKAYADNCHNRTDNNSQTYGCMKYYDDCSTKCETPYKDNCRNRTAVSAPYGCRQYWADCADKCQTAAEEPVCGIGTIYYADGSCAVPEKHDASKTALGVVVHVTDDGKHGQIMAPWPVNASGNKSNAPVDLHWAEGSAMDTDIPALKNYDENGTERLTDYNSCENTDIITATGSASVYPAAWAARKYAPTTETKGKWCLPSSGVAVNIYNNRQKIQAAILALGGVAYPDCCCWTSTEYATEYDLGYYVGTSSFRIENGLGRGGKGGYNYAYVYPVLAF